MLKIRPANLSDAAALLIVHRGAVFSKAAGHYDQVRLEAWAPGPTLERIARIEQEIIDPNYIFLVAEVEGEIVGYASAIPSNNELRSLHVKTNSIGNVGRALLAEIEKQAFAAGAKHLEFDASINAEAFYKANGYTEKGRADHVSANGDVSAAVQMRKCGPT
jgi:N-acetylglutamate synthase-like GNAT family acetyltransferase